MLFGYLWVWDIIFFPILNESNQTEQITCFHSRVNEINTKWENTCMKKYNEHET